MNIQIHEANRISCYLITERPPKHILMKLSKFNYKEAILNAGRGKKKRQQPTEVPPLGYSRFLSRNFEGQEIDSGMTYSKY